MCAFISVNQFVSVSVSTPPVGLKSFQVNNLAIFTKETPLVVSGRVTPTALLPGIYVSPADVLADWGSASEVYQQALAVFSQSPSILDGNGSLVVFPMSSGELLKDVIPLGLVIVYFGGVMWAGYAPEDPEILAASTEVAALQGVKLFASSHLSASNAGFFETIRAATQTHTRCFLYIVGGTPLAARLAMAAYAGRALSVDFEGVNTTATMHGKTLIGVTPDTGITSSILAESKVSGADVYPSVGGGAQYLGKVFSTGSNDYFDNVYNLDWLVSSLQVAGFNTLTQVGTKLPQTETGMAILRGAYITVLQQAVANTFVAPGEWNSSELFGVPADLRRNILNVGWYIYSQPVNQQSQAARAARQAPLVQIAIKFAGAIQSSNVVVSVNQ